MDNYITLYVNMYMVKSPMRPTTQAIFDHIGALRLDEGWMKINIRGAEFLISHSGVVTIMNRFPADIYDLYDVRKNGADVQSVGRAWITRSAKAVMFTIQGVQYVAPLAQVKEAIQGKRKTANVAIMHEVQVKTTSPCAEVPA